MGKIVLCADELCARNPEMVGLGGENLSLQHWLALCLSGTETRRVMRECREAREVWVATCDDVEPINVAAAIKADRPDARVCLVAPASTGSMRSRAYAAGIDALFDTRMLARRYAEAKACARLEGACEVSPECEREERGEALAHKASHVIGRRASGAQAVTSKAECSAHRILTKEAGRSGSAAAADARGALSAPVAATAAAAGTAGNHLPLEPAVALPHAGAGGPKRGAQRVALRLPAVQANAQANRTSFLLPVVSGSGGAGKSAVSMLSALVAQRSGYRTLLLDCDLQFGDVARGLGSPDAPTVSDVIARPAIVHTLAPSEGLPAVLAAPVRLEQGEDLAAALPELVEQLLPLFDVVVANTGSAWSDVHAALLERCSAALFVIDQRASSLWACRHALELCSRCGIASNPFVFAVNRCGKGALYTSIDVACSLKGARAVELGDGGPEVEELLSAGLASHLMEAGNDLAASLADVLRGMLPHGQESVGQLARRSRWRGRRKGRERRQTRRAAA